MSSPEEHFLNSFDKDDRVMNDIDSVCSWNQLSMTGRIGSALLVGVAGGTSSGKTEVCKAISDNVTQSEKLIPKKKVHLISQDSFYRDLTPEEHKQAQTGGFNFDHPDAIDYDLLLSCLTNIKNGVTTKIPIYDSQINSRVKDEYEMVGPCDAILFEGILAFYWKEIRDLFDIKLYINIDADTRLSKRVVHDTEDLGRSLEHVLHQYTKLVKPAFEEFCAPTKKYADIIIPRGADNTIAIMVISQQVVQILANTN